VYSILKNLINIIEYRGNTKNHEMACDFTTKVIRVCYNLKSTYSTSENLKEIENCSKRRYTYVSQPPPTCRHQHEQYYATCGCQTIVRAMCDQIRAVDPSHTECSDCIAATTAVPPPCPHTYTKPRRINEDARAVPLPRGADDEIQDSTPSVF
jgi:hypothetical protein